MRPTEHKSGQRNKPWTVRTTLGWKYNGSLPNNVAKTNKYSDTVFAS